MAGAEHCGGIMATTFAKEKSFFEFFAGGGMARLGLGPEWTCLFANDFDPQKAAAYRENFGADHFCQADVASLRAGDLPAATPDLVWASFPCQDLSLAGARAGLRGARSGAFHSFWELVLGLRKAGRAPRLLVLENVPGLLTSRGGGDLRAVLARLAGAGYTPSALVIDARHFVAQSRRRIFIFGFAAGARPRGGNAPRASEETPAALIEAVAGLPSAARRAFFWLDARPRPVRNARLADILDDAAVWHSSGKTAQLLSAMGPRQAAALDALRRTGARHVGAAYRRIRIEAGARVMRLEARFDGLAGCLRTPAGGSSRQFIIEIEGPRTRSRLLGPREAARLMGLPEDYRLPAGATAALKLCGDGVCVPVVRWIAEEILAPALSDERAAA